MQQADFIREVISRIEKLSLTYCITGSIASNFYGIPRLTHDIDIVLMLTIKDIKPLVEIFGQDCYIEEEAVVEAIRDKRMFNVVHYTTGLKVDFWILKEDEFYRNLFSRRQQTEIMPGVLTWLATPEDVILSKLLWHKTTPSERQLNDAKGILEVQAERLDLNYLRQWAKRLNVSGTFEEIIKSPPPNRY